MKKLIREFKEFAVKGNAVELATAVVIGGAFGKIVSSLVADIIMPLVSLFTGGASFDDWKILLRPESEGKQALVMNIGTFIQNIIDFLLIAASIFLMIKLLSKLKEQLNRKEEEKKQQEPVKPSKQEELLMEIRDILKDRQ